MPIEELNRKLAEAEAKNQRALSMAQQTRKGTVYVVSNVVSFGDEAFKIGMTRRLEPTIASKNFVMPQCPSNLTSTR